MNKRSLFNLVWLAAAVWPSGAAMGADLANNLAVGVRTGDPRADGECFSAPQPFARGENFYAAWTVPLDRDEHSVVADCVRRSGTTPWLRTVFRTPLPLTDNLEELESELEKLVRLVRAVGAPLVVQAVWEPRQGVPEPRDFVFVIKKAAVAVTGAETSAVFAAGPSGADPAEIRDLYEGGVAAYLDLVTLPPGAGLEEAVAVLGELDPGKPLALDALPWPERSASTVAMAAEAFATGLAVALFEPPRSRTFDPAPLAVLAREFRDGPVFDRSAIPAGASAAWTFVREDLSLRVIAIPDPVGSDLQLSFGDGALRSPNVIDLTDGTERPLYDVRRDPDGLTVRVHDAAEVVLLRLDRASAAEMEGFGQEIDVTGGRRMPVEEILRRLQSFEDDQARRISHYQARRTLHLRFQSLEGSFEATYSGAFFNHSEDDFDWVWEEFSVGGVRWRSKKLPKVPLIQPEKVASMPAEIRLFKDYEYRLRGTATIDGRDCWVLDFKPVAPVPGRSLYRGTVWVDRKIFARVRTRATQVGLQGSVLSNEETWFFRPIDATGRPAPWTRQSYVLPLKTSGQQTLSVLSATLPVEVETVLEDVRINGRDFEHNREAALASDATMLRDTDRGLRYLRKDRSGGRVVEDELDSSRLFLVGGVLWDESLDYAIPLAGVNYLDLDIGNTGAQADVFFAGAFLAASIADPQLFGSRFNGGANASGLFVKGTDELYRNGDAVPEESVKRRTASADLFLGRPLARFFSFELGYRLRAEDFSRADDTASEFVLPQDTLTHSLRGNLQYNRAGFRFGLFADANRRSDWEFWGLPDNDEYRPDQEQYLRWRANFTKTWWLRKYRKITLTIEHLDGENLDRFSGYDFGLLGNATIAGYPSGLVRAEKADGAHLTAGLNYLDLIRFEFKVDAVRATNRMTGLDNELLAGFGAGGTITLPWQLIMNFEAGYALSGPGKGGVALRLVFLRLFPGN